MTAVIVLRGGEFSFCAAHAGLHADGYEPLHGHTFVVTLRLAGQADDNGMVTDFGPVKTTLRRVIAPLRRRTLVAGRASGVDLSVPDQVRFGDYTLPALAVAVLPVVNTTTEAIAGHLLDQVLLHAPVPGLHWAELDLAEAPDVSATVRRLLA
ncbi:6-pyruvoyl trahydropterin synthase family protein [Micromonospora antibiotica]|uniref:6-carboxy-5,6,7,8-tetrahydropterin synthase n=1 Tax=Micromonospora antibiotica TaxID=2807623 RepID=A0ABS3V7X9_9ACTN|nr:6-carboxytetrahydropterin synthase [Micromonospora antibiotica]MBO4161721.1 6-carboxytetrahydropterin synthase [Micromonospora antibiotica]